MNRFARRNSRVSPKLLREAMNLPEYRAQIAAPAAPPVEGLEKLADKLHSSGDRDGSELLRKFIREHQRMVIQSSAASADQAVDLRCRIIEVSHDDLPADSLLRNANPTQKSAEKLIELNKLLLSNRAKVLLSPLTVAARCNHPSQFTLTGELPHTHPATEGKTAREICESTIHVLPVALPDGKIRLQTNCDFQHKDSDNPVKIQGTSDQDKKQASIETSVDVNFGESVVLSQPLVACGREIFVILSVVQAN